MAVYRQDGHQRKEFAATFREAREIKIRRTAEEASWRAGPTLHAYALEWVDNYAGRGANDVINDRTRREYRRLLITYALAYFAPEERLRDIDERRARAFVDWLCRLTDDEGHRLCDRSVHNAVLPLQSCLRHAAQSGLLGDRSEPMILLPRRRRGRAYEFDERRFLSRAQLARLLAEIPEPWQPFFDMLASTGLRISEAIALRIMDADLDAAQPRIHVRRAIVDGQLTGPKSRHGRRTIPISRDLAERLTVLAADRAETELLFVGAQGAALRPGNLRYRVVIPAAERAGVPWARFHTLRHTCAALLIDAGASPLRLQRWMGHHSAAFTLDNYGHLIDDSLGPSLDLSDQLAARPQPVL
ncbi:site-specific integrase [Paraconexibacter antarcticus]|uniref:Site-specific integrase n=1 Tax=Paraconexibacter antarcticus TaxID=2949664 RepID=A0ABY5DTJ1_9ACTN|nr:site-specific integrase [Paraconexibacter antarcticus]UTI63864.1 site-specific integrase [Paraconexibacter antarcticus]